MLSITLFHVAHADGSPAGQHILADRIFVELLRGQWPVFRLAEAKQVRTSAPHKTYIALCLEPSVYLS